MPERFWLSSTAMRFLSVDAYPRAISEQDSQVQLLGGIGEKPDQVVTLD